MASEVQSQSIETPANCSLDHLKCDVKTLCVPMKDLELQGVNWCELNERLAEWQKIRPFNRRVEAITDWFKTKNIPYPQKWESRPHEKLNVDFNTLDCTRFAGYYVMALAQARNFGEFLIHLRRMTYREENLGSANEIHYSTEWAENVIKNGYFEDRTGRLGVKPKERHLLGKSLHGQPERDMTSPYVDRSDIEKILNQLQTGDLILLILSEQSKAGKEDIVGHMGVVIRQGEAIYLRHSTNKGKKNSVVDVPFADYIQSHKKFQGIRILRPKERK